MTEITYRQIRPDDPEAKSLIDELSLALQTITGDDGRSSFSEEQFDPERDTFVVVFADGQPAACGAFRYVDAQTCEFKRMYARVKGFGVKILHHLEEQAKDYGYTHIVLSTRRVNTRAVEFYRRNGYQEITPYGKYRHSDASICMGKSV